MGFCSRLPRRRTGQLDALFRAEVEAFQFSSLPSILVI